MTPKPEDWPIPGNPLTDEDALTMAMLILDEKPRSYVEGARRLAQYIVELNLEVKERSEAIAMFVEHDTEVSLNIISIENNS